MNVRLVIDELNLVNEALGTGLFKSAVAMLVFAFRLIPAGF